MIELKLHKALQNPREVLEIDLQLHVEEGRIAGIYGPSGAGKTSLLRMIAGLLKPDSGSIIVDGETWFSDHRNICLKPQQRHLGFVFQDYALFPHMSVKENLEFAKSKGHPFNDVDHLLEVVELGWLQHRKPESLSGGEKQRVALARALVSKPKLLLLDEPLSALDSTIRMKLQNYIKLIHEEFGTTTLLVSHDVPEIVNVCDKVYVLRNGSIESEGTPQEIFIKKHLPLEGNFARVLEIKQLDTYCELTVTVGQTIHKLHIDPVEGNHLKPGDYIAFQKPSES